MIFITFIIIKLFILFINIIYIIIIIIIYFLKLLINVNKCIINNLFKKQKRQWKQR